MQASSGATFDAPSIRSSHTVPHSPAWYISRIPSSAVAPSTSRSAPSAIMASSSASSTVAVAGSPAATPSGREAKARTIRSPGSSSPSSTAVTVKLFSRSPAAKERRAGTPAQSAAVAPAWPVADSSTVTGTGMPGSSLTVTVASAPPSVARWRAAPNRSTGASSTVAAPAGCGSLASGPSAVPSRSVKVTFTRTFPPASSACSRYVCSVAPGMSVSVPSPATRTHRNP